MENYAPLAQRMRPDNLDSVVGQRHLLGEGCALRSMVDSGRISNMIFFGPPGTGKTTVAKIAAAAAKKSLYTLNGTTASTSDIKDIIAELDSFMGADGVVVYLDEIQYFNKKQQQTLLSFMESGHITLIASTTENPYFYVYPALLSRSSVFEFKPLQPADLMDNLLRAAKFLQAEQQLEIDFEVNALELVAESGGGDVRRSLNSLELLVNIAKTSGSQKITITPELVIKNAAGSPVFHDKDGDSHYDLLSAFQKSIRGSDPNAAVYYLARLLEGGDMAGACRRLMVTACEDIGLAWPQGISIVQSAVDIAFRVGMPEARLPLVDAVILLCTAPKSNSGINAYYAAMADIESGRDNNIPAHLRDAHYDGAKKLGRGLEYKYSHDYKNNWVAQQFLPDKLKDKIYYRYGDNKTEQAAKAYWDKIKGGE